MSKLQRTETNLHLPAHQPKAAELEHPRKETNTPPAEGTAEEKNSPTGSRHPQGHKVKDFKETMSNVRKNKYFPLADSMYGSDIWFQPKGVTSQEKNIVTCVFEEYVNGENVSLDQFDYVIFADDLLKMLYLAEKIDNVYYNMETEDYELWLVHKYSEMLEANRSLDINDHASLARMLISKNPEQFILGKQTNLEVYFQKRCVREFTDAPKSAKNSNVIKCKSLKGKFEYVIEARIFVNNEDIHSRKLGDLLPESQAV